MDFGAYEFQHWYPKFAGLTTRARVLTVPESFREYLLADGIALYGERPDSGALPPAAFHAEIESAISELGGAVAPKLNWSAPVDSTWMLPDNTMRCLNANDVYMLLKSSDHINHDIELQPNPLVLVLREWFDLHPSSEFRCFVFEGRLVAISQRQTHFYEFLEAQRSQLLTLLTSLVQSALERFGTPTFVLDAHVSQTKERAFVIDFNPWDPKTDSILFAWDELDALCASTNAPPELRLVERQDRTRAFSSKPFSTSHVPADFVDMQRGDFLGLIAEMKAQRAQEDLESTR